MMSFRCKLTFDGMIDYFRNERKTSTETVSVLIEMLRRTKLFGNCLVFLKITFIILNVTKDGNQIIHFMHSIDRRRFPSKAVPSENARQIWKKCIEFLVKKMRDLSMVQYLFCNANFLSHLFDQMNQNIKYWCILFTMIFNEPLKLIHFAWYGATKTIRAGKNRRIKKLTDLRVNKFTTTPHKTEYVCLCFHL